MLHAWYIQIPQITVIYDVYVCIRCYFDLVWTIVKKHNKYEIMN